MFRYWKTSSVPCLEKVGHALAIAGSLAGRVGHAELVIPSDDATARMTRFDGAIASGGGVDCRVREHAGASRGLRRAEEAEPFVAIVVARFPVILQGLG